jgi:hypothetical protein
MCVVNTAADTGFVFVEAAQLAEMGTAIAIVVLAAWLASQLPAPRSDSELFSQLKTGGMTLKLQLSDSMCLRLMVQAMA